MAECGIIRCVHIPRNISEIPVQKICGISLAILHRSGKTPVVKEILIIVDNLSEKKLLNDLRIYTGTFGITNDIVAIVFENISLSLTNSFNHICTGYFMIVLIGLNMNMCNIRYLNMNMHNIFLYIYMFYILSAVRGKLSPIRYLLCSTVDIILKLLSRKLIIVLLGIVLGWGTIKVKYFHKSYS